MGVWLEPVAQSVLLMFMECQFRGAGHAGVGVGGFDFGSRVEEVGVVGADCVYAGRKGGNEC